MAQSFGRRDRAAQRRVDARRTGEQRTLALSARRIGVPLDLARGVLVVERWVLAPLRKRRFFSIDELNAAIAEQVALVNERRFRGHHGGLTADESETWLGVAST